MDELDSLLAEAESAFHLASAAMDRLRTKVDELELRHEPRPSHARPYPAPAPTPRPPVEVDIEKLLAMEAEDAGEPTFGMSPREAHKVDEDLRAAILRD